MSDVISAAAHPVRRLRALFDDLDLGRLHIRLGLQTVLAIALAELVLHRTPLWPAELAWAGLIPLLMGFALIAAPDKERHLACLLLFAPIYAVIVAGGSLVPVGSVWFLPSVALVGFLAGLALGGGPVWGSVGVTGFVGFAAAASIPLGTSGLVPRLEAVALGWFCLTLMAVLIRWPHPPRATTVERRIYRRLARLLDEVDDDAALEVQPLIRGLMGALPDWAQEEGKVRRLALMRNAAMLLAQAIRRSEARDGMAAHVALLKSGADHASAVFSALAEGAGAPARLAGLKEIAAETRRTLEAGPADAAEPIDGWLRRAEAHYALVTLADMLEDAHAA